MRPRLISALVFAGALAFVSCRDDPGVADGPSGAEVDEPPYGPGVDVGETYDYDLPTHCGVEWARIDGAWWQTTPLDDGNANPPPGWGNPHDGGRLRVVDERTAVYTGGPDVDIEFERTDLVDAPIACD